MEELRLIAGATRTPPLTMRDLLAVIFRQLRVVTISFLLVLLACVVYRLLSPSYRAEMKILISRGRVDPALTAAPTQAQFEREEVNEEELNSEAELLHDQEILTTVTQAAALFPESGFSFWKLMGESERLDLPLESVSHN
jgi:uncharacterized protein involved in exopolysaccharide biosynthesis